MSAVDERGLASQATLCTSYSKHVVPPGPAVLVSIVCVYTATSRLRLHTRHLRTVSSLQDSLLGTEGDPGPASRSFPANLIWANLSASWF